MRTRSAATRGGRVSCTVRQPVEAASARPCALKVCRAVEVHAPEPCVRPEETGQFVRLSSLPLHLMYLFASVLTRPRLKFSLTAWLPPEVISVILLYGRPLSRRLSGRDAL